VFEDPLVLSRAVWLTKPVAYGSAAVITIGVTAFAHWFHRVRDAEQD